MDRVNTSQHKASSSDEDSLIGAVVLRGWMFLKNNPSIIPTAILGLYLTRVLYRIFLHPLSKIPGPLLARFSHLWLNVRYFRGSWHDDALKIHKKYGPVVRIAPNEVSFVDEEALKKMYGHGKGTLKTPWYSTWIIPNMEGSFFATQSPSLHKALRGRVSNAYSMSSILAMEPYIQGVADKCWSKMRKYADKGEPLNMSHWASYFAFDVVGQLALGGELGFVEKEEDVDDIIASIHNGFYLMSNMEMKTLLNRDSRVRHVPFQMWWINNAVSQYLINNFGSKELKAFGIFLQWLATRVEDRMKNGLGDRRKDMLQHFIEMKGIEGKDRTDMSDIMIEGVNILGAGADTTTIAILAVIGRLSLHPKVIPKLQEEIDKAYKDLGLASSGSGEDAEISFNDAIKLPYLCAVVKEAMRLHPSIQYQLPRFAPEEGIQIDKYYLPRGTHAGISPRSMNRSQQIFGNDADEFRPERWVSNNEKEEEEIKEKTRLLTTFGMGSRVCVGQNIALVEVHKFTAQFVRNFDFEVVNKDQPWKTKSQWFSFQSEFWVKLKARNQGKAE